jgi:hypothetical protein
VIVQLNDITSRIQAEENWSSSWNPPAAQRQLITAAEVSKWPAPTSISRPDRARGRSDRDGFNFYYVGLFLCDEAREFAVLRAGTGEAGGAC